MKKFLILSFISILFVNLLNATIDINSYSIDNQTVDKIFNKATETNFSLLNIDLNENLTAFSSPYGLQENKSGVVAFVLGFFLGALGIHRLYLGTSVGTFIAYLLTGGGCGIVYVVDWIVLLVAIVHNNNIDQYIDNPRFLMWN